MRLMRLGTVALALCVAAVSAALESGKDAVRDTPPANVWNAELAAALVGKTILVGKTYAGAGGERYEQLHGVVTKADPAQGIALALEGPHQGETYWLPPDTRGLKPAKPGSYRLRSTGEVIEDPDYLAMYVVEPPTV
ncbi:hypothetical protein [Caulobacter sp. 17J80-11]|uniref:hypothetical protein n=1 Tax=Caulobacter sp. 17J80-11 TaxID=2763502 RepID=UPI0016534775|nr:hypothetical protein [Caulobacter sp. 17J80-11]MBC6980575.1 hypothetical protein [Caulobacter sp. 17J80-11]